MFRSAYVDAAGRRRSLTVSPRKTTGRDDIQVQLPVSAKEVAWAGLIPHARARSLTKGVVLQGAGLPDRFEVSEVIPAVTRGDEAGAVLMPLDAELLPQLRVTPFGKEERVTARVEQGPGPARSVGVGRLADSAEPLASPRLRSAPAPWVPCQLVVDCRTGTAPAGIALQGGPWYLPEDVDLELVVTFAGSGEYEWAVSDKARASREAPLLFGKATAAALPQTLALPIPRQDLDRSAWASWSLICPREGGQIILTSVKLVARRPRSGAAPSRSLATWAWQPALWVETPDLLLERLRKLGATTVYLTVPVAEADLPAEPQIVREKELERFIARATAEHVRVWAVVGDPRAVFPEERPKFVRRAQAYADYNRRVAAPARLAGIQYDIEPYVLPGYQLDPEPWNSAYLATISAVKAAAAMPLEVVLPFWYTQQKIQGRPLLDSLAPYVDGIAVMDYRSDPTLIQQFAEPFLSWGMRTGRPVRIALEAGAIRDEVRRHYQPAAAGELWLSRIGENDLLILLKRALRNPRGLAFRYSHTSTFLAAGITFHEGKPTLLGLLPELEEKFGAWTSFAGLAVHGWEE